MQRNHKENKNGETKPKKERNVCKQNPILRVQYCWTKVNKM